MKRNATKRICKRVISGMLSLVMVLTVVGALPIESDAADAITVVKSEAQTYVEKRSVDGYIGTKAPKPTKAEYADWLFSGWYTDEACSKDKVITAASGITSGTYYAKFVPEEVLTLKFQVSAGTTAETTESKMRLVSTVDSEVYSKVGFQVEIDELNYSKPHETTTVYSAIAAKEDGVGFSYQPNVFQFAKSKYFVTATVTGIPQTSFSTGIRVTPYWVTMDGTSVNGVGRTMRVADSYSEVVNVPIRVYSDNTLAANDSVTVSYDSTMYTYAGIDRGTLIDTAAITVDSDTTGQVVCTVNDSVAAGITAEGMLANLRFTKNATAKAITVDGFEISEESDAAWNTTCEVYPHNLETAVTDGIFTKEELYSTSVAMYNNGTNGSGTSATQGNDYYTEQLTDEGVRYVSTRTEGHIRTVNVLNTILNTADYDKLTVKIKNANAEEFTRWRLYINPDVDADDLANHHNPGTQIVDVTKTGAFDISPMTVSAADANNWITVTFDLSSVPGWIGTETIKGFALGFVTTGTTQDIAEMRFSKTGADSYTKVIAGEELKSEATVTYDNKSANISNVTKTPATTGVKHTFPNTIKGAIRNVCFENMAINASDYTKITVKIRDTAKTAFSRWRFYVNPKITTAIGGTQAFDKTVAEGYNDNVLTVSEKDADGWVTVTFHLNNISAWTGTLTGFGFGYVCSVTGGTQEIAYVKLEKATRETETISADGIYSMAKAFNDNNVNRLIPATLQNTGVKYDFLDYGAGSMKSIYIDDLDLNSNEYSKMTFRMRSLSTDANDTAYGYTGWYFYINPDTNTYNATSGALERGTLVLQKTSLTANAAFTADDGTLTMSAPDENGWVTVTVDFGSISKWYEAGTIKGIHIGYVNKGVYQEIEGITLGTSTKVDVNGVLSATYLKQYGKAVYQSGEELLEQTNYDLLSDDGIKYYFSPNAQIGGYKGVKLENLNLTTAKYNTMKVRIRTLGEYDFTNYKLWLATDKNGNTLTEALKIDSLGNEALMESGPDENGWKTVTIDLSNVTAWTGAETVTGMCFSYLNYSGTQEIADIRFQDTTGEFSASKLYKLGTPYTFINTNSEPKELIAETEELITDTTLGTVVQYTNNSGRANQLKAICVDDVSFVARRYDTLTVRIKDVEGKGFTLWRLFVNQDTGTSKLPAQLVSKSVTANAAYSDSAFEVTAPDSNGWITVTFHLDQLTGWPETITGFTIGYVSAGTTQQIASANFTFEDSVQLIYSENATYMQKRYPYLLKTEVPGLENATYSTSTSTSTKDIIVTENDSLDSGTATIVASGVDITCTVADYYGFEAVLDYFKDYGFVLPDGTSITVAHTDNISGVESSIAYANNKADGDFRIMSYNVAWSSKPASTGVEFAETTQRDELQAQMIKQYMPDVLGLQEMGTAQTEYGNRAGLKSNIESLGYTEVTASGNMTDGNDFTPILYNSATMTEVASGAVNTFSDGQTDNDYTGKKYTWAVLASRTDSNKQILVVNTHLHTSMDTVNLAQAKEIQGKITELSNTYSGVPVAVIGDLNSHVGKTAETADSWSYDYFITEGYTNPSVKAKVMSKVRAHHTHPIQQAITPFGTLVIPSPDSSPISSDYSGKTSVDHILFKNITNMNIFGVVVDEITNATSDHYPIFVDFSF